jgi:hypothetical protein
MKIVIATAFILTLATWMFCYLLLPSAGPLSGAATSLVFGFWFAAAWAIRWIAGQRAPAPRK